MTVNEICLKSIRECDKEVYSHRYYLSANVKVNKILVAVKMVDKFLNVCKLCFAMGIQRIELKMELINSIKVKFNNQLECFHEKWPSL
jgi:hypothetical protein